MRAYGYIALGWLVLLRATPGSGQICNSADPESGGNVVPAYSTGGAIVCLKNLSDPLNLQYVNDDAHGGLNTTCVRPENDPQPMAVLYFILLIYTFSGVGIIADIFMDAIGVITSVGKWIAVREAKTGKQVHVYTKLWNPTVANLTLMALGSSAPEILLSVIEIASNDFYSGDLGPSTIVGSAAFNGLVIIAVCISCLPSGDTRKIDDMSVFSITAFSSVFAYVWLLLILQVFTPNIVTLPEGLLTFFFFPILVITAWMADAGYFSAKDTDKFKISEFGEDTTGDGKVDTTVSFSKAEAAELLKGVDLTGKTDEELLALAYAHHKKASRGVSRVDYRNRKNRKKTVDIPEGKTQIGFESTTYSCKESVEYLEVAVARLGDLSNRVEIKYSTKEDEAANAINRATEGEDYHKTAGTLVFPKGNGLQTFKVKMIDDDEAEEDETFLIELFDCSDKNTEIVEDRRVCTVTIIDDNDGGIVSFAKIVSVGDEDVAYDYVCNDRVGFLNVRVVREEGSSGQAVVRWQTLSTNADIRKSRYGDAGEDAELEGLLIFETGVVDKYISLPIVDNVDEVESEFSLVLSDPKVCVLGDLVSVKVAIRHDAASEKVMNKIASMLYENYDDLRKGSQSYPSQFKDALTPEEDAGVVEMIMFVLNVPWRLLFAFVPPPSMLGGWPCFFIALAMIAGVTALIGDLASLLGCSIGLKDSITAITLVALGTSLPDTFASKAATIGDANADAAIGNVTGSNSVNVFLGLGLPWMIAAGYWKSQGATDMWVGRVGFKNPEIVAEYADGGFAVPAGSLGFSVTVFCVCQVACLVILFFRRITFGFELGAIDPTSNHSLICSVFLAFLWFFYVTMSVLQTYEYVAENILFGVTGGCAFLFLVVMGGLKGALGAYEPPPSGDQTENPVDVSVLGEVREDEEDAQD